MTVSLPAAVDVLGDPRTGSFAQPLGVEGEIERVVYPNEMVGEHFTGTVCDVAENGAGIVSSVVPPLLARVGLSFTLEGGGTIAAIGIVMWRRRLAVPGRASFGVLFEAIELGNRSEIARAVAGSRD
jgi:hypothetical protein